MVQKENRTFEIQEGVVIASVWPKKHSIGLVSVFIKTGYCGNFAIGLQLLKKGSVDQVSIRGVRGNCTMFFSYGGDAHHNKFIQTYVKRGVQRSTEIHMVVKKTTIDRIIDRSLDAFNEDQDGCKTCIYKRPGDDNCDPTIEIGTYDIV